MQAKPQKKRPKVIPPEEDRRRLLQECEVGSGNARLLGDALVYAKPENLKDMPLVRVRSPPRSGVD